MPLRRPPRLSEALYVGYCRVFLTLCTDHRRPWFVDAACVDRVLVQFRHSAQSHQYALLAWCFMPDHLHAVVEGLQARSNLQGFVRGFRQRSGFEHRRATGARLWQEGYYDHVLRSDESTVDAVRYVLENPVRAALVEHPTAYPFSGSDVASIAEWFGER